VRRLEVLVRQPGTLGAKEHRRRRTLGFDDQSLSSIAYIGHAEILIAVARSGRRHETAAGQRLSHRAHDSRAGEHIVGARRTGGRLAMRELLGIDQHQLVQRHVFHGPRHSPDVAGVGGLDEHDTNVG